jgi:hypothetical protein
MKYLLIKTIRNGKIKVMKYHQENGIPESLKIPFLERLTYQHLLLEQSKMTGGNQK